MGLRTSFTRTLDLSVPIVGAPMAGVSGPALAAAVARAGGLGLLGAARYTEAQLRKFVILLTQPACVDHRAQIHCSDSGQGDTKLFLEATSATSCLAWQGCITILSLRRTPTGRLRLFTHITLCNFGDSESNNFRLTYKVYASLQGVWRCSAVGEGQRGSWHRPDGLHKHTAPGYCN